MAKPVWEYQSSSPVPRSWLGSDSFVPRAVLQPIFSYLRNETAGGVVMLIMAVAALVIANTPLSDLYFQFWETPVRISFGEATLGHLSELTVRGWVNQGLMTIFFFVAGLEIKRQVTTGELSKMREAVLPVAAAIGGMLVPAAVYMVAMGSFAAPGWAIPIATDIAFALGILSIVGHRAPFSARVFLVTMAIVDSLLAIAVIALFFTGGISIGWLMAGAGLALAIFTANRVGIAKTPVFVILGIALWLTVLESGVHATVAGVMLALLTPIRPRFDPARFGDRARNMVDKAENLLPEEGLPSTALEQADLEQTQATLAEIVRLSRGTLSPLTRFEARLQPISAFVVVPVFAFANAGVRLPSGSQEIAVGVMVAVGVALLIGKILGVSATTWLTARLSRASLPPEMKWRHLGGLSALAAIGFTIAIFVTDLTFPTPSPEATGAKLGIFAASIVAALVGAIWLHVAHRRAPSAHLDDSGDHAATTVTGDVDRKEL